MRSQHPWAFERSTLWMMDLDAVSTPIVVPQVAAHFGEVQRGAAGSLATAIELADSAAVLRRLDAGRRCFAAWVEDEIVAYGWVSQGVECIGELERPFRMLRGDAYVWDCATLPPFRRRRLYTALLTHIAATVRDEGIQRLWIAASLQNHASIRGIVSAGFQPVVKVTYARLFDLNRLWMIGYPAAAPRLVTQARTALIAPTSVGEQVRRRGL